MRNYNCKFCTVPCLKDSTDSTVWICKYCDTKYYIDLYSNDKYHYMLIEESVIKCASINGLTNITTPAYKNDYIIKVDYITNTTIVYQLCQFRLRTKVLELPYDFTKEKNIRRPIGPYSPYKYDIRVWLDYNLTKMQFPEKVPAVDKHICYSCNEECSNMNPRFNLYWKCDACSATYYLENEPPHKLRRAQLTCERDENTSWRLILNYNKNTTTLSYQEDKSEVEVIKFDYIVKNVFAHNLSTWIKKVLLFL